MLIERFKQFAPGVQMGGEANQQMGAMLLTRPSEQQMVTKKDVQKAAEILREYKQGKSNLEKRIVDDELWWEQRHWEVIRRDKKRENPSPEPTSGWLFNAILNKHADAMDNYPEPLVLPRERADEQSAKVLSSVLPVVMEYNDFEKTYSENWWEKLKHGTSVYGVMWDPEKENGLGDVSIKGVDLLKIFWEPGITDLQKSRNLFSVELVDNDILEQDYPELIGKLKGNAVEVKEYIYDDAVDNSDKSVVVDWYYKRKSASGKTLLHYVKFVGDTILYASENDQELRDRGFYDHGMYPFVADVLFPEKGTPIGFGYVAICKDPQLYIDKLSSNIMENAMMTTKKRFFVSESTSVNKDEFMDWNNPLVTVSGELDDRRLQEIVTRPLDGVYVNVLQMKIEEMKDTAANRDVNSGGSSGGATAAAAIAALQEAGNKASRDMISASYRAYTEINRFVIELIRQFYDEARSFRITGQNGEYQFIDVSNDGLADQVVGMDSGGVPMYRHPIFDLKLSAQKKNPFSRMEQNERAKELYAAGFFNPERAQEALNALDMMDFEGVEKVREKVKQGYTLLNICQQLQQENAALKMAITGQPVMATGQPTGGFTGGGGNMSMPSGKAEKGSVASGVMQAQTPMTSYGEALAKRSHPSVNG